jgi:tetratricopeptide (TPR) repeat protein
MHDAGNLVENLEAAQEQKERGTAALQAGETSTALQRYVDAIGLLKIAHQPPDSSNEQLRLLWQECARRGQELELACRLNAALCHIKLEQWTEAVDAAGEAVRMDGKSAKAHFRRGVARAGAGQDEAAAADLRTAAKLAPKDKAIRRELAAVKERLAVATSEPSEGTAAMSAAIASGSLYPDAPETPEAHAEVMLAKAEQMHAEGRHADALEHCKRVFRLLKPGFAPDELALQRFRAHVLSAKCHKLASTHADTPEKRSGSLTRATADLEKALSMLEGTLDISDAIGEDEVESARVELRSLQVTSTAETEQKIAELVRGAGAER